MKIFMRVALESDLPQLLSLYAQLGQDDGSVLPLEVATSIYCKMQSYPDYRLYVALDEDRVIGTFAMLVMDNLRDKASADLMRAAVASPTPEMETSSTTEA